MTAPTLPDSYLLLALAERPDTSPEPRTPAASSCLDIDMRCLNVAGRWAVHGSSPRAPLLVWHPTEADAAHAAAARASEARRRPVAVVTRKDGAWVEGRDIQVFTEAFEPALHGSEAQSAGKARRLGIEMEKLAAFSLLVRAAAAATSQEAYAEVSRAASKALRARFGGGSISSTCAWLAGRAGQAVLADLLAGEVETTGPLSIHEIVEAVELAQRIEAVQKADQDR